MLKDFGLVPSLISALDDPYVSEGLPYWGGQAVWKDILGTLPKVVPSRGTPFQSDMGLTWFEAGGKIASVPAG